MIKLGTGNTTLYLGDKKVKAVWLGGKKVYPNSFLELSASSLSFAASGTSLPLVITVNEGQAWAIATLPAGFSASVTSGTGPASVTITAANNTSETTRTGSLTVISEELTASCSLLQTAGTKVYGAWQNVSLETEGNITSFAASGGTAKIHMVVERTWTWNGMAGSGGTETNWSQPANVTVSDAIASVSADVLTIGSLGTTFKAATQILIGAGTASDTISTHRKTLAITQAANYVVKIEGVGSRNTLSYSQAPAGGGTSSPTWAGDTDAVMDTKVRTTFSSGATAGWSAAKAGGAWSIDRMPYSWSGASGNFTALNSSTGAVTVSSKVTTFSATTSGPVVTCNIYYKFTHNAAFGGSAVVAVSAVPGTATPTQAANYVTAVAIKASTFSYGTIGAGGGTMNPTVPGNGTLTYTFSSGSSTTTTPTAGGTETRVVTFSMSTGNGFTGINTSSGAVTASSKGTTISGVTTSNTITRTLVATFKNNAAYGGTTVTGTGSSTTTCSQAANALTSYTLSRLTANGSTIPYAGGTLSVTVRTYAYPRYSSGSTGTTDTLADVGQPSDNIGISWLSRLNVTKAGAGTYTFSYSAPQNSGTGDRTGNLTFSLSGKSTSLTVRQSGIPTYSLRIGAMTQAALNAIMPIGELNLSYNKSTPVVGSAGAIKLISLPSGVGNTAMVSWQGEGLQYFNLTSRMGGSSALVIKLMPSTQSGKILSGATTQRGTPVNLQGQVDGNTTIVLGIYIEGEA